MGGPVRVRGLRAVLLPALSALLAACGHGEPFTFSTSPQRGPFEPGAVARLTYNPGDDLDPAWLLDGAGFLYTSERQDRADRDRCFAQMAPTGGTVGRVICNRTASNDSIDMFESGSPGPGGRLAYMYSIFDLYPLTPPRHRLLVIGTVDSPTTSGYLLAFPYRAEGGYKHYGARHIRWLTPTSFVYNAVTPHYPQPCKVCRRDAATPIQLVLVELAGDTAVTRPLPLTITATSVTVGDPDMVYFTIMGDSRVFRQVLSTGDNTVLHDFGPGTIARDVTVRGDQLFAVVGGRVALELVLGAGVVQNDDGGEIRIVDLATGAETVVDTNGRLFRHVALSPDGRVALAESLEGGTWDIWRIELP